MVQAQSVKRTAEIEEISNLYLIHPLASRLVPVFAAVGISANAVSLAGMALGILAGVAYYHFRDLRFVIIGFVLMIGWHVLDGADGQLARLTHSQSELGKVLDGICDYVTFVAVYSGLAAALAVQSGSWIWLLVLAAGLCHAVQSAAYERQRQEYDFWTRERKTAKSAGLDAPPHSSTVAPPVADLLHRLYARAQSWTSGATMEFHNQLVARLDVEPGRSDEVRVRYRETFAPALRRWSILSANYRTLGIFIAAVFKAPEYYFWFEIFGFSTILFVLLARQRARYARFLDSMNTVA